MLTLLSMKVSSKVQPDLPLVEFKCINVLSFMLIFGRNQTIKANLKAVVAVIIM